MFCNYCGKPLNPGEVCSCQQPQPVQQPYYGGYFTTEPASPAIAILRKHGSSVLMLLTAIFTLVGTLLNIVSSAANVNTMMDFMRSFDPSVSQEIGEGGMVGAIVGTAFGSILNYVSIGVLFAMYRNCKKPKDAYITTGGLTFFKVMSIIAIVAYSFAIFMVLIMGIIMMALGGELAYELEYYLYEAGMYDIDAMGVAFSAIFAVVFLILAGILIFGIIVQASLIKTINSLKKTCTTGEPAAKIGRLYPVMLIISAVFSSFNALNVISFITYVLLAAASIMSAVLLFRVRKDMNTYIMSTVQPSYMPPVYPQNDGPTAYYYNPQPVQPVAPAAPVIEEPVIEAPVVETPVVEAPVIEMPEAPVEEVPEIVIPVAEPTAEPVAEVAEELVEETSPFTTCPNCGKAYAADANFCVYCGTKNPNK